MRDELPCQVAEKQRPLTCDGMRKTVTGRPRVFHQEEASLYGINGERKYLNQHERARVLAAIATLETTQAMFSQVLAWTGARVSEVLALSPQHFQVDASVVTIITLKRRKHHVREVPIPPTIMEALDRAYDLRRLQCDECKCHSRLWSFCRMSAWRIIKRVMAQAGVVGLGASPKGLRHAFGVCTLQSGVPMNLVQRWMGHARLSTTAIYLDVSGPEEILFARRFWSVESSIQTVRNYVRVRRPRGPYW